MDGRFGPVEKVQCSGYTTRRYVSRCRRKGRPNGRGTMTGTFFCHDHKRWLKKKEQPLTWLTLDMRGEMPYFWFDLYMNRDRSPNPNWA